MKQELIQNLQAEMQLYGYQPVELPMIEEADLFLTKAGDQIVERLFTFQQRGHTLALRPEFTAAAAHRYISRGHQDVVRWQFSGPVFEDDPQGDQQHRLSIGAELIGLPGPGADAEIIGMAAQALEKQGITDWQLVIGHVGLMRALLSRFALDDRTLRFLLNRRGLLKSGQRDELTAELDHYLPQDQHNGLVFDEQMTEAETQDMLGVLLEASNRSQTMGGRTRHDIARRLLAKRKQAAQRDQIDAAVDFLESLIHVDAAPSEAMNAIDAIIGDNEQARRIFSEWQHTLMLLTAYDIPGSRIVIQPDLARTWDYYTGIVFEIHTPQVGYLAGGGRYDELARLIGAARDIPAVGFAYYADHIAPSEEAQDAHILRPAEGAQAQAVKWAQALRAAGVAVVVTSHHDATMQVNVDGTLNFAGEVYTLEQVEQVADAK